MSNCGHDPGRPLPRADRFCRYTASMLPSIVDTKSDICVAGVVAVDGSPDLQFGAVMGLLSPAVLRKDACLACCLAVCRKTNFPVVIL